jgi:drug/metabolite transporter (DMT)-like permease
MLLFVGMVIFAFGAQFLQTKAMFLCSSPALILPFSYVSVIFALLLDVFVFGAVYNGLMVIGMAMASVGLFTKFILHHLSQ